MAVRCCADASRPSGGRYVDGVPGVLNCLSSPEARQGGHGLGLVARRLVAHGVSHFPAVGALGPGGSAPVSGPLLRTGLCWLGGGAGGGGFFLWAGPTGLAHPMQVGQGVQRHFQGGAEPPGRGEALAVDFLHSVSPQEPQVRPYGPFSFGSALAQLFRGLLANPPSAFQLLEG